MELQADAVQHQLNALDGLEMYQLVRLQMEPALQDFNVMEAEAQLEEPLVYQLMYVELEIVQFQTDADKYVTLDVKELAETESVKAQMPKTLQLALLTAKLHQSQLLHLLRFPELVTIPLQMDVQGKNRGIFLLLEHSALCANCLPAIAV
jgi:hypothetical protein